MATQPKRSPFKVLVWCAWACVVWFALGFAVLKGVIRVPVMLQVGAILSGVVVALGCVLAFLFLLLAARRRPDVLNGVAALAANAALLAFFMVSLP
jgi:hypothetical protein